MFKKLFKLGAIAGIGYWVYNHPKELQKLTETVKEVFDKYEKKLYDFGHQS